MYTNSLSSLAKSFALFLTDAPNSQTVSPTLTVKLGHSYHEQAMMLVVFDILEHKGRPEKLYCSPTKCVSVLVGGLSDC